MAAPPRPDDQILSAVAVDVDPADTRTELAEAIRKQRLPLRVVEQRIHVYVSTEQPRARPRTAAMPCPPARRPDSSAPPTSRRSHKSVARAHRDRAERPSRHRTTIVTTVSFPVANDEFGIATREVVAAGGHLTGSVLGKLRVRTVTLAPIPPCSAPYPAGVPRRAAHRLRCDRSPPVRHGGAVTTIPCAVAVEVGQAMPCDMAASIRSPMHWLCPRTSDRRGCGNVAVRVAQRGRLASAPCSTRPGEPVHR